MLDFKQGDAVIATLPDGYTSKSIFFIAEKSGLATCLYLSAQKELVSTVIPTAWLELPKPKQRTKSGGGGVDTI